MEILAVGGALPEPAPETLAGIDGITPPAREYSARTIDFTGMRGRGKTPLSITEEAIYGPRRGQRVRHKGTLTKSGLNKRTAALRQRFSEDFGVDTEVIIDFDEDHFISEHLRNRPRDLRYQGAPSAYARGGKVYIGPDFSRDLIYADAEASAQAYRAITHELLHTASGIHEHKTLFGLEIIFEEGAIEITSKDWTRRAMAKEWMAGWTNRYVTDLGSVSTTGIETMIRGGVYRDHVVEIILQSSRRVGWDKTKILDDIASFLRGNERRDLFFTRADGTLERFHRELLYGSTGDKAGQLRRRDLRDRLLKEGQDAGVDLDAWQVDSRSYESYETGKLDESARDEEKLAFNLLRWLLG